MTTPLITDLDEMRRLAAARRDEFDALAEAIDFDDTLTDDALDALVDSVARPIIAAIDCKQCANCCRSLDVCLIPTDIERLAEGLLIPVDAVMTRYADQALGAEQGEWAIVPAHPCPLLRDRLCSIYDHRPHACRLYPQLTPDFRYNVEDTIEGAFTCPIIYNVLSELTTRIDLLNEDDLPDEA